MIHIVICANQDRAERYCKKQNLPPADTVIIMFTGELSVFLMRARNNQTPATVHHIDDNYKFLAKQFERII